MKCFYFSNISRSSSLEVSRKHPFSISCDIMTLILSNETFGVLEKLNKDFLRRLCFNLSHPSLPFTSYIQCYRISCTSKIPSNVNPENASETEMEKFSLFWIFSLAFSLSENIKTNSAIRECSWEEEENIDFYCHLLLFLQSLSHYSIIIY